MKDQSNAPSRFNGGLNDNSFSLRDSLDATTINPALQGSQHHPARQPLQRQAVLDIIQNVLALLDDDEDFDSSFGGSSSPDSSRHPPSDGASGLAQ